MAKGRLTGGPAGDSDQSSIRGAAKSADIRIRLSLDTLALCRKSGQPKYPEWSAREDHGRGGWSPEPQELE